MFNEFYSEAGRKCNVPTNNFANIMQLYTNQYNTFFLSFDFGIFHIPQNEILTLIFNKA